MHIPFTPLTFVAALFTGAIGAYLAYRRGRNPYVWFAIGSLFGILGVFALFFAPKKKLTPQEETKIEPVELLPPIQGPANKFWYYLTPDHQQMGPMSLDALTNAWRQGKISTTTFVWNEELPDWKPLQDLLLKITSSP